MPVPAGMKLRRLGCCSVLIGRPYFLPGAPDALIHRLSIRARNCQLYSVRRKIRAVLNFKPREKDTHS